MKKILLLTITILLICTVFLGCNLFEPKQVLEEVRLSKDYPEDELPLYDDAFVYESDGDDESVTIRYASKDDIDDVVDFYKDLFENNSITLDKETDRSSRYTAEGLYSGFKFEVVISEAGDEYAGDFKTLVRVDIEFSTESIPQSLDQKLIGFWRLESIDDGTGALSSIPDAMAAQFIEGGTVYLYSNFLYEGTASWETSGQANLLLTSPMGEQKQAIVTFEQRDGRDYMTWVLPDEVRVFYRDTTDGFALYDPNAFDPDAALAASIVDKTWYYVHYYDGSDTFTGSTGYCIYYSEGTFEEEFNGTIDTGTWYISENHIYCVNDDGTTKDWAVEVICDSGECNLYFYGDGINEYWLYSDTKQEQTVSDSPIADIEWFAYYNADPNGIKNYYTASESMVFYSDGLFKYYQTDGSIVDGTWGMEDNVLTISYTSGTVASWTAELEYLFGVNTLYLTDNEGYYWVYTDIYLGGGPVVIPDDRAANAIIGIMFDSLYYEYSDNSTATMTDTHIIFYENGYFDETFGGTSYTGTWSFANGILHMEYPELNEIHDFPDSYIEYDSLSGTMILHMGDDQTGYEGGHYLFETNPL